MGETVQSTSEPERRGSKLDCAPCYEKQVMWSMRTHGRSEIALGLAVASQGGRRHQNVCPTLVRLTPQRPPLPATTITATIIIVIHEYRQTRWASAFKVAGATLLILVSAVHPRTYFTQ